MVDMITDELVRYIFLGIAVLVIVGTICLIGNHSDENTQSKIDSCMDTAILLCGSKGMEMSHVYMALPRRVMVRCVSELEIADYRVNCEVDDDHGS